MQVSEILEMKKGIKAKLMAATSLLLVSAILLSLTTYAWFILSTAPEVTEMQTTAGANGSLEIALQSSLKENGNFTGRNENISSQVGDSSALTGQTVRTANTTWGNIVDLSSGYGLEQIALTPTRLNLDAQHNVVPSNPLLRPEFGQDGRITELLKVPTLYYEAEGDAKGFQSGNAYGVKVYGNQDDLSGGGAQTVKREMSRQWLVDMTARTIEAQRNDMRNDLKKMMEDSKIGVGIITIMNKVYLSLGNSGGANGKFDNDDIATLEAIFESFGSTLSKSERSLRYALLGCCAADKTNYPAGTDGEKELSAVYAKFTTLPLIEDSDSGSVKSIAEANGQTEGLTEELKNAYGGVLQAVKDISAAESKLKEANAFLSTAKSATEETQSGSIYQAILKVFSPGKMFISGSISGTEGTVIRTVMDDLSVDTLSRVFFYDVRVRDKKLYCIQESGLFSNIASVTGDYSAKVAGNIRTVPSQPITLDTFVTCGANIDDFSEENNSGCLKIVHELVKDLNIDGTVSYEMEVGDRVSAYGYSVDLAFRSTKTGNLQLQQTPVDRITNGDTPTDRLPENQTTQGEGSVMSFGVADDMSEEQALALLQSVYIVFMDTDNGEIYGVAAATDGKYITQEGQTKNKAKVTATLAIYEPVFEDGLIKKGTLRKNQSIISMISEKVYYVSAVVFLNGDNLSGMSLSADTTQSLFGSINLQFSSSADLQSLQPDSFYESANQSKP